MQKIVECFVASEEEVGRAFPTFAPAVAMEHGGVNPLTDQAITLRGWRADESTPPPAGPKPALPRARYPWSSFSSSPWAFAHVAMFGVWNDYAFSELGKALGEPTGFIQPAWLRRGRQREESLLRLPPAITRRLAGLDARAVTVVVEAWSIGFNAFYFDNTTRENVACRGVLESLRALAPQVPAGAEHTLYARTRGRASTAL